MPDARATFLRATRAVRRDGLKVVVARKLRRRFVRQARLDKLRQRSKKQAAQITSLRRQLAKVEKSAAAAEETGARLESLELGLADAIGYKAPVRVHPNLTESPNVPVGEVDFGDFRRLTPISELWGYDRGLPIDRFYIERFLGKHADDIRGHVLEVGDDAYTRRFGGARVQKIDVLNLKDDPGTTIQADLSSAPHIPSDQFDCIVFTQTLQLVWDLEAAVATLHRILRPGGVLLATFPGITHTQDVNWFPYWYWNLTSGSATRLFGQVFPPEALAVEGHGNVLATVAFLEGIAAEELRPSELDFRSPTFDVTITVRGTKPAS